MVLMAILFSGICKPLFSPMDILKLVYKKYPKRNSVGGWRRVKLSENGVLLIVNGGNYFTSFGNTSVILMIYLTTKKL